jgi:hypothetical protein
MDSPRVGGESIVSWRGEPERRRMLLEDALSLSKGVLFVIYKFKPAACAIFFGISVLSKLRLNASAPTPIANTGIAVAE